MGFGVDGIDAGIDGTVPVLYRALTLDVKPDAVPAYVGAYADYAGLNSEHCIGNWYFEGDSNSSVQGRYFWYKILPSDDQIPEIAIVENPNVYVSLKPAPVEV